MSKHIIIQTSVDLLRIPPESIIYISSDGNYSTIFLTNGDTRIVTVQIGVLESNIATQLGAEGNIFIRIGRSLIVNRDFIYYINIPRQQLVLSDVKTFTHTVSASKDSLKLLKEFIENEKQ